jgi:hypothetical protein
MLPSARTTLSMSIPDRLPEFTRLDCPLSLSTWKPSLCHSSVDLRWPLEGHTESHGMQSGKPTVRKVIIHIGPDSSRAGRLDRRSPDGPPPGRDPVVEVLVLCSYPNCPSP